MLVTHIKLSITHDDSCKTRLSVTNKHRAAFKWNTQALVSKMPVQNSNSKISAHPDSAIYLPQILLFINTFNRPLHQKCTLHFSYVLEDALLEKYLVITPKRSLFKIIHRNVCLFKTLFQETASQAWQFWKYFTQKSIIWKTFEGETSNRSQTTTLLQIFC